MTSARDKRSGLTGRLLTIILLAGVAGCQTLPSPEPPAPEPADGPPPVDLPHLAGLPDPQVVELEKSRYGNPPSYTVAGRTYRVMASSSGYAATGVASWYGRKFHGRRTSSGEPFDMFALSAAHRSLPIPVFARVTNLDNGASTIVRINDRGPFHADRLVDLSYAAAVKLGFADKGTANVRLEVVEPQRNFYLQAGAFTTLAGADALKGRIEALTGEPAFVVRVPQDDLYRVRIGPVRDRSAALRVQSAVAAAALPAPLILP